MKLYLVRHGQSEANAKRIINDAITRPVPLTETGTKQVQESAKRLKNKNIEIIYASPFLRTQQTAEIIAKEIGAPIIQDIRLQEYQMGMDGRTSEEWKQLRRDEPDWKPPRGESIIELVEREKSFLQMLKDSNHERVVIVGHESPLVALSIAIQGGDIQEFRKKEIHNAEIVELVY